MSKETIHERKETFDLMDADKHLTLNVTAVTVFLYAFYSLKTVWLAFDRMEYSPTFYYIGEVLVILCAIFAVISLLMLRNVRFVKNVDVILLALYNWLLQVLYTMGENDYLRNTFTLFIIVACFAFTARMRISIFELFYQIILYTSIISLFVMLCYVLGINIGIETVPYYSHIGAMEYKKWLIFAIYKNGIEMRLCGIFLEPGCLGTVCSLLYVARSKYSKRWEKAVLLLAVFFSFSLAGYLLIFIYEAINSISKSRKNILLFTLIIAAFFAIPYIDFGNDMLNHLAGRFALTGGGLAGDNRVTDTFALKYNEFIHSYNILFGHGTGYALTEFGNLSYKTYVVEYGIVGFGLWMVLWAKAGLKRAKGNRSGVIFVLLFMLSLYQRPRLIESIYGYVLLFGGLEWMQQQENTRLVAKTAKAKAQKPLLTRSKDKGLADYAN